VAKTPSKNRNIVIKSQFNINGSRGKNVGSFISDYVARENATDASMAYLPPLDRAMVPGDGVAFTLDQTAISKDETLYLASKVQGYHDQGDRAIEQLVISFAPDYLYEQGLVPEHVTVHEKGDYRYNYDDIRLRHAVRAGIHAMIENEDYYNGNMVAAIQSDTLHLHVHAVVYEDFHKISRKRGKEERGILRQSSLNRLVYHIDRQLEDTKDLSVVPTQRLLTPETLDERRYEHVEMEEPNLEYVNHYLRLIEEKQREELARKDEVADQVDQLVRDIRLPNERELGE